MESLIIDTHCHLYLPDFKDDIELLITTAKQNGIIKIILPNIDVSTIEAVKQLHEAHPGYCLMAMGLHPCSVNAEYKTELELLKKYVALPNVVGVGETGIDLYWDKTFLTEQIDSFKTQAGWAFEYKKPIIIHVRESFNETFAAMDDIYQPGLTGVFHCFTGNEEQAKKALSYHGFYLGIGGVLTYKTSTLRDVLKTIPVDRLVFETDAPYLPPVPYRGKRNEPSYIIHTLQTAAQALEMDADTLANITTANAKKLFGI